MQNNQVTPDDSVAWISVRRDAAVVVASLVFLALGGAFFLTAIKLDLGSVTMPGPGLFPTLAASILVILSGVMLVQTISGLRSRKAAQIELGHGNSALAAGLLIAVAALFEPTGALLTSFVLVGVLAAVFTGRWLLALLFAAALSGTVMFVFPRVLGVPLPPGIFSPF